MSTYVTRKNRHNDPVIRRQPTSARPLHHQGLGRAGVHEPGASDTVGDLTHCSVPMQRVDESLAVELPQDRWLTCPHRRYAPHATEQTRLAEVVSGTESKDDLPVDERLKLAGFDDKEVVGPLTLAEQGMAGAHLKAAIPIDRKQR